MFVELVQGRVLDSVHLERTWRALTLRIARVATGWLGATAGKTADQDFIAILSFESEEAARSTMGELDRREIWAELRQVVADPTFRECPHVRAFATDAAGSAPRVEIWQGAANATDRIGEMLLAIGTSGTHPSIVAGLLCADGAGTATVVLYRRSEPDDGEVTPELVEFAEVLFDGTRRLDLSEPWSAGSVEYQANEVGSE